MTLSDWEYFPHLGPRPIKGFVGLRNAGATCYMNSVLQQVCGGWGRAEDGWEGQSWMGGQRMGEREKGRGSVN